MRPILPCGSTAASRTGQKPTEKEGIVNEGWKLSHIARYSKATGRDDTVPQQHIHESACEELLQIALDIKPGTASRDALLLFTSTTTRCTP